jgi:hypothetical protein
MTRMFTLLLVLSCASFPAVRALAQPSTDMDYGALVELGLAEFDQGRWPEAREHFRRAHALEPSARTLRAIGNASFELSDYPEAVRSLTLAIADTRRPLTAEQRTAAAGLIERSEAFIGRVELTATPATVSVRVDGQTACQLESTILVMAGAHTLWFEADGFAPREARVTVAARSTTPLAITLEPLALEAPPEQASAPVVSPVVEDTAGGSKTLGIIVAGSGGAVTVLGVVFLALGMADANDVEGAPAGSDFADVSAAYDRAPTRIAVGSILAGVGLAATATGIVLATRRGGRDASSDTASLRLSVQPTGLSLRGSF